MLVMSGHCSPSPLPESSGGGRSRPARAALQVTRCTPRPARRARLPSDRGQSTMRISIRHRLSGCLAQRVPSFCSCKCSNFSILVVRAQISQFELFELILLLKSSKRSPRQPDEMWSPSARGDRAHRGARRARNRFGAGYTGT